MVIYWLDWRLSLVRLGVLEENKKNLKCASRASISQFFFFFFLVFPP